MQVRETYAPVKLAASGTLFASVGNICGFFCTTAGTVRIFAGTSAAGTEVVASFPVAVGTFYPLPFSFGAGCYAELGGGAVGTFGIVA